MPGSTPLLVAAALCIAAAILKQDTHFHPALFAFLPVGLILGVLALFANRKSTSIGAANASRAVFALGLASFAVLNFWRFPPVAYPSGVPASMQGPWALSAALALLGVYGALCDASRGRLVLVAMAACFVALGIWVIRCSPSPAIDVWVAHQYACAAAMKGMNPFAITYPDIYGPASAFMDSSFVKDGMVQTGYPYPPATLLLSMPGYAIAGDFRYANLFAVAASAVLLGYFGRGRSGRHAVQAGLLLLLMPQSFFIVESGWTEAHALLLLICFTWCTLRVPRAAPFLLGAFLVSKQNLVALAPLALVLCGKPIDAKKFTVFTAKVCSSALVLTVPWAIWNWPAFDRSVLAMFHGGAEKLLVPRPDSLTFWAAARYFHVGTLPASAVFAALAAATVLCLVSQWRSVFRLSGFLVSVGVVLFASFIFSHHAFANHYYLIFGAFLAAAAAGEIESSAPSPAVFAGPGDAQSIRAAQSLTTSPLRALS